MHSTNKADKTWHKCVTVVLTALWCVVIEALHYKPEGSVRFEVSTAVTMKNVLWDVTPCGSCKNRRFGGT
jgi:hypothetical protein